MLLSLLLLGSTVSFAAAAGDGDDPLISLSYLTDTFLPRAKAALSAAADRALSDYGGVEEADPGTRLLTLPAGKSVLLGQGQQFTLLSGGASVAVLSGEVVDVTAGAARLDGPARLYSRCIVCEGARARVDVTEESVLKVSRGAEIDEGCPFLDVGRDSWYYADVAGAYRRGLVNGMTATRYEPAGTLTGAQCVKLAACMHQLWNAGAVTLENDEYGLWYRSYVLYALANGILRSEPEDYDSPVSRAQFVEIFYQALPGSAYGAINAIPDGAIPDVDAASGARVYAFYRAGILTGYTDTAGFAEHAFGPGTTISRAEVATIMNRMFDETARVRFTI